jgi:hypothetical protein
MSASTVLLVLVLTVSVAVTQAQDKLDLKCEALFLFPWDDF